MHSGENDTLKSTVSTFLLVLKYSLQVTIPNGSLMRACEQNFHTWNPTLYSVTLY